MRRLWVSALIVAGVALVGTQVHSGKPERDAQAEIKPKIAKLEADAKAACGCPVKLNVQWDGFAAAKDMARIPATAEAALAALKKHCEKPDDKKALCKSLTTVDIVYIAKDCCKVELKGKSISATSNGDMYPAEGQFSSILEKF